MDVPNWHVVKMMSLHGDSEPIQLTALMQIRCFTKYKFRKTAGKFSFPLYFNELNSAQEPLEKTDPGSTRGVWRDGILHDHRSVFGLHLTDKDRKLYDAEMHRLRELQLRLLSGRKDCGLCLLRMSYRLVECVLAVRLYPADRVHLVLHHRVRRKSRVVAMDNSNHTNECQQHRTNAESRWFILLGYQHYQHSV